MMGNQKARVKNEKLTQRRKDANRIVLKIKWCTFGVDAFLRLCASALKTNMYPFPAG
jgi:hypothetical protein